MLEFIRRVCTSRDGTVAARSRAGLVASLALSACATTPAHAPPPQDPWERINRPIYSFNDRLDKVVARPVARVYVKVVPHVVRVGVTNFFRNLDTPTVMVNDALQGKFRAAGNDLGRFLMNSIVGLGGILDPASSAGLDTNNEDFGQTLGKWGVGPGPFIELPLLGPSDLRDAPARFVDSYLNPRGYIKNAWIRYGLYLPDLTDRRAALLPLDEALARAFDPYAFVRDAYLQRRAYLVADGASSGGEEPPPEPEALDERDPQQRPQ